jgi:hypothetical protein
MKLYENFTIFLPSPPTFKNQTTSYHQSLAAATEKAASISYQAFE